MSKSILIAEPLDVIRMGLRTILTEDTCISDIIEVINEEGLKSELSSKSIDLTIVNQELVTDFSVLPQWYFVIMSTNPSIPGIFQAFEHKARAYISPNISAPLLRVIFNMTKGSFLVEPTLIPLLLKRAKYDTASFIKEDLLTPREKEIFQLLQEGHSRSNIAELLTISEATLKTHLKNIRGKQDRDMSTKW